MLTVSNLDKALWPGTAAPPALTKRDLLRYFARVSPLDAAPPRRPAALRHPVSRRHHREELLPEALGRPAPPFARTVAIYSGHGESDGDYLVCENLPTLLWLGQMAGLELHAWYSRTDPEPDATARGRRFTGSEAELERSVLNYPDFVVFDLDPYDYSGREARGAEPELHRRAFNRTRRLALQVREQLERPGPHHLRQDLGADRTAPLSPDRARPRLRRRPRRRRDDRQARRCASGRGR